MGTIMRLHENKAGEALEELLERHRAGKLRAVVFAFVAKDDPKDRISGAFNGSELEIIGLAGKLFHAICERMI